MELACNDIETIRYVGRASFDPAPKVDSIVLKFTVKKERDLEIEKQLIHLWKVAFAHPRKTLLSNLKGSIYNSDTLRSKIIELGYDERVRAEAIRKEDWIQFL
jgi:16S rRNA (adenine1518-N6/adenine1519-N6)-dimethyltransferase